MQILPFIEQDNLYKQLDHTKPWDDPANLKVLEAMEMPKVFEHPGRPAPKGHTYFRIFTLPKDAKGTERPFFKEGQRGPKFADDHRRHVEHVHDRGGRRGGAVVQAGRAGLRRQTAAAATRATRTRTGSWRRWATAASASLKPSKLGEKTLRALITTQRRRGRLRCRSDRSRVASARASRAQVHGTPSDLLTSRLPAVALAAGLFLLAGDPDGSARQQRSAAGPAGQPPGSRVPSRRGGALPVVPKSAGAFVSLKVSALVDHPDLKPVLEQLKKKPEALDGISGTDRRLAARDRPRHAVLAARRATAAGRRPVLVVTTTREPYNEARVLKALKADPVFDDRRDPRARHGHGGHGKAGGGPPTDAPDVKTSPNATETGGPGSARATAPDRPEGRREGAAARPPPPLPTRSRRERRRSVCPGRGRRAERPALLRADRGAFEALFLVDDRTLVFLPGGSEGEFANWRFWPRRSRRTRPARSPTRSPPPGSTPSRPGVHLTPLFREFDRRMPPELVPYTALLAARTGVLTGDLDKSAKLTLTLTFDDAAAAKRAAPVLEEGIATVAEKVAGSPTR